MHVDTETMWDLINIHYYKEGKPLIFGVATDDSHRYHSFSSNDSNSGRGWVMVCLLYTSPSPRDKRQSRMPSSA